METTRLRRKLKQVQLVAISSVNLRRTVAALRQSMQGIDFGRVTFFTHANPRLRGSGIEVINIPAIRSADEYSRFVLKNLTNFISLQYCLIVQADGYVIRPLSWTDDFLKYDYIGAPWPDHDPAFADTAGTFQRVGNGGFSLRSSRLMQLVSSRARTEIGSAPAVGSGRWLYEDVKICVEYRPWLEQQGCSFPSVEIAARFSTERPLADSRPESSFGFHGIHPYRIGWSKSDWLKGWGIR